MRFSNIAMTAAALSLLAGAAVAQPAGGGAGRGPGGNFTQEERAMQAVDRAAATKGMDDAAMQDYRTKERAKMAAMSEADMAKYKADLDARWAKLSKAQQDDAMKTMQAAFQGRGGAGGGGPRPAQ